MLAESFVIDLYLAEKFDLLGSNRYEAETIKAFYSSIHYLRERCLMRMTWTFADKRKEAFERFTTKMVPWWIKVHEQHLERNGGNGHFFGDKVMLATQQYDQGWTCDAKKNEDDLLTGESA